MSCPLDEQTLQQIKSAVEAIEKRESSVIAKSKGDEAVKRNAYAEAISLYQKSVEIDENEYALSNQCLCYNKVN